MEIGDEAVKRVKLHSSEGERVPLIFQRVDVIADMLSLSSDIPLTLKMAIDHCMKELKMSGGN